MLSSVLSRGFCQVLTEAHFRSYPTFSSFIRTFSASNPTCGGSGADEIGAQICPFLCFLLNSASVVTYAQLKTMLSNRDIQLFDVRTPDEYQAGRIPEAVNIPLDTLEESLKLPPDHFEEKFQTKTPGKNDDNIVFHCKSGNRSGKALSIAYQLGFYRARHYKGGYSEWVEQEGK
ncbi:thiosulfate:glutathione sulfurtransferase [Xenentodon cancila]